MIVSSAPKSIKLNLFQRVMALWEEICPYNAGYVFHLRGRVNFEALEEAIQESSRSAGVGRLVLDHKGRSYSYEPIDAIRLDRIQGDPPIMQTLCEILTERMNAPFPHQPHHPIRWAVLNDFHTESHFLVAVWRHLVADAFSMRLLVGRVLARCYGMAQNLSADPMRVHPPDYTQVMRRHHRRLGYLRTLARSSRIYFRLRYVYRMPELINRGDGSRVLLFDTPPDLIGRLIAACRRRKATVNDAFLAALGSAIAQITPSRQVQQRRRRLALATAVDVRQVAAEDLSDCFGLFVGHWVTLIDDPDVRDFERVLAEVARQTFSEKAEKRFAGPEWHFAALLLLHRWLSVNEDRSWYRKVYPLSAGLSNIRINASEFPGGREKILGCFLVPPTGPALPLVLSPATLDDTLKISAVYQEASLNESEVRTLIDLFLRKLESFSKISNAESC